MGRSTWDDYLFAADASLGKAYWAGLAFAYRDPEHYHLFRVSGTQAARAQILRVAGRQATLLAESRAPLAKVVRARLKVDVARGRVAGFVDDVPVAEALAPLGLAGRIGLYAAGDAGAGFGRLVVWLRPEEAEAPPVDAQLAREESMATWASPGAFWRPDDKGVLWHSGDFYGDASVRLALPHGEATPSGFLAMGADGLDPSSGYQLLLRPGGATQAHLQLAWGGKVVAEGTGPWGGADGDRTLRLWRDGDFIAGALGSGTAVVYRDASPLEGTKVAAGRALPPAPASLEAETPNVLDCAFSRAPTEWWTGRGAWEVTQRWPCDRRWSFFGGMESEAPILWTKRSFTGDITVEAWVAMHMDDPDDDAVGYRHPSDLNLSFCTDGRELSSGYSFLFGAAANTCTRILRGEQVVAETPGLRMEKPDRHNFAAFHRHWFHLRAEKRKDRIRFFVDGLPAGEYVDPNPLPGGQVAFWTCRNGLLIARTRIWYQKESGLEPLPVPAVTPAALTRDAWDVSTTAPVTLASSFERGTEGWAAEAGEAPVLALDSVGASHGTRCLRAVSRGSGGLTLFCGARFFDAVRFPIVRFDYRVPDRVKLSLYFYVGRKRFAIRLSGPSGPDPGVEEIAAVPGFTADGTWRTAQVDLLAALRRHFPGAARIPVQELCFASTGINYLGAGFGGHNFGTEYRLDHFRLVGGEGTSAEDAAHVVIGCKPGRYELMWHGHPVPVPAGGSIGQSLTVRKGFVYRAGIPVPTWDSRNPSATLRFRKEGPQGAVIAERRLEKLVNNAMQWLEFPPQPTGRYYIELCEPTETIGWWCSRADTYPDGEAFVGGKPVPGEERGFFIDELHPIPEGGGGAMGQAD